MSTQTSTDTDLAPPPYKRLATSALVHPKASAPPRKLSPPTIPPTPEHATHPSHSSSSPPRTRNLTIFSLPLELRQSIYEHALSPSPTDPIHHLTPSEIHISLHLPRHLQAELRSANYWSSRALQKRLRLLRAHSAIHAEASAVLYARFAFSFPPWHDAAFFRALRAWLAAPVPFRATIRALRLGRALRLASAPGAPLDRAFDRARDTPPSRVLYGPPDFAILAGALKGLRRVAVDVRFAGADVCEADVEWAVQAVLGLARPFRGVAGVELRDGEAEGSQRRAIVDEARRRIREDGGWWRVPAGLLLGEGHSRHDG